jgi:hypothetical protein
MSDPCTDTNTNLGCQNTIIETAVQASVVEGIENRIESGRAHHVEGEGNVVNSVGNVAGPSENNHVEGLTHTVAGYQNHVDGCNHIVNGFESHVSGCNNRTNNNRAGQNISGYGGYFMSDQSESFSGDIYNYSKQLAGGLNERPEHPGEGISMIDKTLANGIYPIGQHQAYRNTSDGLSYSIMLKGVENLREGTFVTFGASNRKERLLVAATNGDDIVGVITESSGFIANAGQFPASTRIKYDPFHKPVIKLNKATTNGQVDHHPDHSTAPLNFPGYQTVPLNVIDRAIPFVPFTDRDNYYQVAMAGLVVVRASSIDNIGRKCGVKDGVAINGNDFWVVKIINRNHIMILLK